MYVGLAALVVALMGVSMTVGAVGIPPGDVLSLLFGGGEGVPDTWRYIVLEVRLPQTLSALLCGSALSVSGLLLQTCFSNALAGPDVFGISSGASLGVALVVLLSGGTLAVGTLSVGGFMAIIVAAFVGAMVVMAVLLGLSVRVRSRVLLLVAGLMVGYVASSVVTLLNASASTESVRSFVFWGMASFGNVAVAQMPLFVAAVVLGLCGSLLLAKPLDALLLGDQYAEGLGVNVVLVRRLALVLTGLLTAVTVAFCGPVSFIGLAVPHLARLLLRTGGHRSLLPATLLGGAAVALLCNVLCSVPVGGSLLPLNAVTPLLGAPVVIYVILRRE